MSQRGERYREAHFLDASKKLQAYCESCYRGVPIVTLLLTFVGINFMALAFILWTNLLNPIALGFLAPKDAASLTMMLASATYLLALVSPLFGSLADSHRDFRPTFLIISSSGSVATALLILSLELRSPYLFCFSSVVGGAMSAAMFQVGLSFAAAWGVVVPERAGAYTGLYVFTVLFGTLAYMQVIFFAPLSATVHTPAYATLALTTTSFVSVGCLIPRWVLQPHRLIDVPSNGAATSPPTEAAAGLRQVCSAWCSQSYRAFRVGALGGALLWAGPAGITPMNIFFFEDYVVGEEFETFAAVLMLAITVLSVLLVVPLSILLDKMDSLTAFFGVGLISGTVVAGMAHFPTRGYELFSNVIIGTFGQLQYVMVNKFLITYIIEDSSKVSRDVRPVGSEPTRLAFLVQKRAALPSVLGSRTCGRPLASIQLLPLWERSQSAHSARSSVPKAQPA
jgi:MFS family permease